MRLPNSPFSNPFGHHLKQAPLHSGHGLSALLPSREGQKDTIFKLLPRPVYAQATWSKYVLPLQEDQLLHDLLKTSL